LNGLHDDTPGRRLDKKFNDGYTPLHFAAQNGHLELVDRLVELQADLKNHSELLGVEVYNRRSIVLWD